MGVRTFQLVCTGLHRQVAPCSVMQRASCELSSWFHLSRTSWKGPVHLTHRPASSHSSPVASPSTPGNLLRSASPYPRSLALSPSSSLIPPLVRGSALGLAELRLRCRDPSTVRGTRPGTVRWGQRGQRPALLM